MSNHWSAVRVLFVLSLAAIFVNDFESQTALGQAIEIAKLERNDQVSFEKEVLPILQRNCLACHNRIDRDGELVLESTSAMQKGGDTGPAIVPGKSAESLLLKLASHSSEPIMPPEGNDVNASPLTPAELGLIRLWIDQGAVGANEPSVMSPKSLKPITQSVSPVYSLEVSEDGQYLATSRANQLFIYHIPTGRLITQLVDSALANPQQPTLPVAHGDLIQSLALNRDGNLLASGSFREVKLWRRPSDVQTHKLSAPAPLVALGVSADGKWIATADAQHTIQLWNAQSGQPGAKIPAAHKELIRAVRFLSDTQLLSASVDQTLRVWNVADGAPLGLIDSPSPVFAADLTAVAKPDPAQAAAATPTPATARWLVSGGPDKFLRSWVLDGLTPQKTSLTIPDVKLSTVSSDQRCVAFSSADGTIRVFTQVGNELKPAAEWKLPGEAAQALCFIGSSDPNGNLPRLATSASDGTVSLWSLPAHELVGQWRAGLVSQTSVTSSHDGKQLATGAADGFIRMWDVSGIALLLDSNLNGPVETYALSPSRSLLALAGIADGKPIIAIRNLENGQVTHRLSGATATIRSVAFSDDNARLVASSDDSILRVWNLGNPQEAPVQLAGLTSPPRATAFSHDGSQIISASVDNIVRVWKLADSTLVKEFSGHTGEIVHVGFLGNEPYSISKDRTVRFWNLSDGSQVRTFSDQAGTLTTGISQDGQLVATGADDKQIRLYQLVNGQHLQTLQGHRGNPTAVAFSNDGKRLISTALLDNVLSESIIWDLSVNPPRIQEVLVQPSSSFALFHKVEGKILLGNRDGKLFEQPTRFLKQLDGHQQPIRAMVFQANGQQLFSGAQDGGLRCHNTANGQQTFATSHGAVITAIALSANEQMLATAGENGVARLWQSNGNGFGPQQLTGFNGALTAVKFASQDTQILVSGITDAPTTMLFDLQTGTPLERFRGHQAPVVSLIARTNEGSQPPTSQLMSISSEAAWQFNTHAGRVMPGHSGDITGVAAMPEAPRQIFSCSDDTTLRLWNLENGQAIRQYNHGGKVLGMAVRADGKRVASCSDNHTAKLWNIDGQQIAEVRGDLRLKTLVARLTQQQNSLNARLNVAKQRLDVAEKDVPLKTEAEKKAADTLAETNKQVNEKTAEVDKTQQAKIAAEKNAIDAAAAARMALVAKTSAEDALKLAQAVVPVAQQRATLLAGALSASPTSETLKKAAEEAQLALTASQQQVQAMQQAMEAPTKAAQDAATKANEAAQQVGTVQKPYNDALALLKTAKTAQNLAAQQHLIAQRELKMSQDYLPLTKQALTTTEAAVEETKNLLQKANEQNAAADLIIRSVAFSPDGSTWLTSGDFTSLHTWDAETGTALATYVGHTAAVGMSAYLDSETLVSISADQTARVWQRNPSWRLERTIGAADKPDIISHRVMSLDFDADSTRILVGSGVPSRSGELAIFKVDSGERVWHIPQAHEDEVFSAQFSPDGKRIASAGADKFLRTFDIASQQQLRRFEGHTNYVLSVVWKSDGQTLASAGADQTIKVWDAETADQQRTIEGFGKHVTQVAFMGDTDNVVTSCGDRTIRMHSAGNGGNFRNFAGPESWPHCVAISQDSNVLATGTARGKVHLWNGNNGQLLKVIQVGQATSSPQ